MELSEKKIQVLQLWKDTAEKRDNGTHFTFTDRYKQAKEQVENIKKFLVDPSEENFTAFWSIMDAAQHKAVAKRVYRSNDINVLKQVFTEMLDAKHYKPVWEEKVENARRVLWELFGRIHIETEAVPPINQCTTNGLKFFGYSSSDKYESILEDYLKFKHNIYSKYVGHATKGTGHEVPLNLEIDQLLNVIDKVKQKDVRKEKDTKIQNLFHAVVNLKPSDKSSNRQEIDESLFWHFWKISPGEGMQYWEEWKEKNVIAVGWKELGDISGKSKEERDRIIEKSARKSGYISPQVSYFYDEMEVGDIVAVYGKKKILAIARIDSPAEYQEGIVTYNNIRKVTWLDLDEHEIPEESQLYDRIIRNRNITKFNQDDDVEELKRVIGLGKKRKFKGFTKQTFEILKGIEEHKLDKEWIKGIKPKYDKEVREPLWNLAQDVADEFFVDKPEFITDRSILSAIKGHGKEYKSNLWFAFYRKETGNKQNDYQYFVYLDPSGIRLGLFLGKNMSKKMRDPFLENAIQNADKIYEIYTSKLRDYEYKFEDENHNDSFEPAGVDELVKGIRDSGNTHIVRSFGLDRMYMFRNPAFPIIVANDFHNLEPIYQLVTEGTIKESTLAPAEVNFEFSIGDKLFFENPADLEKAICTALKEEKHIILIGPPGTGKTKLARIICEQMIGKDNYILTTATADWTTFDTIGGYMPKPNGEGELEFRQGKFLDCFKNSKKQDTNKWLIIDEINRADIDKAFGQLFSVLTKDKVELPFKNLDTNEPIVIVPSSEETEYGSSTYRVHKDWRLIGTMNTYDKSSLYEMSFAFMRRFAFIHIDTPVLESSSVMDSYTQIWKLPNELNETLKTKIFELWVEFNKNSERKIGPAIIEDVVKYAQNFEDDEGLVGAFNAYILPQLEGMREKQIQELLKALKGKVDTTKIIPIAEDMFKIKLPEES